MRSESWRERAQCRGVGFDVFFPPEDPRMEGLAQRRQREASAKRICARCPVAGECLEWALENRETRGIWGGRTELERKAILRAQRRVRLVV
ncbi:transcription factor WhiB [Acidimicrobium ferrooxidans DSM 10331]|uniref:Transcriptional regulator WhiB n=1 Tax=Acidimicrobium ferrooxidans (strain DSM 10331 / JCM 15462 / NBRC 103882 / ICP) TaxID=525909 RepID=C7M2G4_ACIFD|nr:transcription factor WhiB [Acidimicrobium ferrooxidans DSM 10331]